MKGLRGYIAAMPFWKQEKQANKNTQRKQTKSKLLE